ncbi:putative oxidoreductase [Dioszegia hungarica]|uniref:Oxidoreductase n=1 Tax=Dioszegia hungarica TaxID=4972 RepID=A0AA38HHY6_9TREE|nr:putative oxidoreductase [Dioszegia hungarica]KAI9639874.1 putative oxidoreductase [Dioszegia hungarica]
MPAPARVILVGVAGFGASHLTNLRRLASTGHAQIVGLVDPSLHAQSLSDPSYTPPDDAPLFPTLSSALSSSGQVDIVVLCVPIHLHAPLTREALLSGADVLLEKPPFARMADFEAILQLQAETGRKVQVGFQSLGSLVLPHLLPGGEIPIGRTLSVRAKGTWLRREGYWNRAPWVGRRSLGETDTMDGVATNALAHAVITSLQIAGMHLAEDVAQVELEMYRANPVDVDDTTSLRVTPSRSGDGGGDGARVTAALTLCAAEQTWPTIDIVGEGGTATFEYVTGTLRWKGEERTYDRVDLLQNLIEHRWDETGTPLLCPLRSTGAFMRVLEAVRTAPEPVHIQRKYVDVRGEGSDAHHVVQDVEKWVEAAADAEALFSEVGAPWAFAGRDKVLANAILGGRTILEIQDGGSILPTSSPRPYIHPIRTLSGVEVSATHPADHDWHCGLGFAVPDVDGCSFWGGGTYVHGKGYVDLENHGRMTTERVEYLPSSSGSAPNPSGIEQTILWTNHLGHSPLRELRSLRWSLLPHCGSGGGDGGISGWVLSYRTTLTALAGPVSLGSPGTNGRPGGGYGGFFWRLPRCSDVQLLGAGGKEGEEEVHGQKADWISWSAVFEGRPGAVGEATIVIVPEDEETGRDRWVVRRETYPGIGSAVAWEERTEIADGRELSRGFRVAVVDGRMERDEVEKVVEVLRESTSKGRSSS